MTHYDADAPSPAGAHIAGAAGQQHARANPPTAPVSVFYARLRPQKAKRKKRKNRHGNIRAHLPSRPIAHVSNPLCRKPLAARAHPFRFSNTAATKRGRHSSLSNASPVRAAEQGHAKLGYGRMWVAHWSEFPCAGSNICASATSAGEAWRQYPCRAAGRSDTRADTYSMRWGQHGAAPPNTPVQYTPATPASGPARNSLPGRASLPSVARAFSLTGQSPNLRKPADPG